MLLSELLYENEVESGKVPSFDVHEIVIDSRRAKENSVFVCLVGSFSDGHRFAMGAYENGCRYFVAEKYISVGDDAVVLSVENTREMLAKMACRFFGNPSHEIKVIGLTGTKGKTTTALMITELMNSCGKNCGYIGSNGIYYNKSRYKTANTTPESLILQKTLRDMVDSGVKYVALEVSSQALYTYRVDGVHFDSVIYTNLARDHIGGFEHPTMEHYIDCKASLFNIERGADLCIYNIDDSMAERITGEFKGRRISFSVKGNGDINAENLKYFQSEREIGTMFDIVFEGEKYETVLPMPGDFNVVNAVCAFGACTKYIDDRKQISDEISHLAVDGRFEMFRTRKGATFVIDYAHNGLSLGCALEELRKFCTGKLICVFGSVGDRTFERREELGSVAATFADYCIVTSDNPGFEDPEKIIRDIAIHVSKRNCPYSTFVDREKAIKYAYSIADSGDIILLAGKGHETYQLIKDVKEPFSEKRIVQKIIAREKKVRM